MATNFEKFKQLLEKRAEATSSAKSNWLKMEKGSSKAVRFLPLKSQNLELPIEIYDHHAITFPDGKHESFVCRKKKGEGHCPFCDLASEAWKKYSATKDENFKEAFKQLVAKTAYLLVGYDIDKVDPADIKAEDTFIVRVSSKDAVAGIDNFLSKGKDFVDFTNGRSCTLKKPTADKQAITWTWEDPEPAFSGKSGKDVFAKLVSVSHDLTSIVASPSDEKLEELVKRYKSVPAQEDDEDTAPLPPVVSTSRTPKKKSDPVPDDATSESSAVDVDDDTLAELKKLIGD